tara:strand:+ start:1058 stop:2080 length:1023 start_codon:yes stop_codon:yes gene_type:complete
MSGSSLKLLDRFKPNGITDKVLVAQTLGDGKIHLNLSSKPQGVCVEDTVSRFKKFLYDTLSNTDETIKEILENINNIKYNNFIIEFENRDVISKLIGKEGVRIKYITLFLTIKYQGVIISSLPRDSNENRFLVTANEENQIMIVNELNGILFNYGDLEDGDFIDILDSNINLLLGNSCMDIDRMSTPPPCSFNDDFLSLHATPERPIRSVSYKKDKGNIRDYFIRKSPSVFGEVIKKDYGVNKMVEECKKNGILRHSPIPLPTSFSWFTNGHFEPIIRSLSPKNYLNCDWSSHGTSQESDYQQGEETSCSQCTVDFQDGRFFSKSPDNLFGGSLEDYMEE